MFAELFSKRGRRSDDPAEMIYAAIVAAARRPVFYREFGAPDTLPGRFELVVLHAALVLRRLRAEPDGVAAGLGQRIFDEMFRVLDANLREIGVGDLSVPKRIKAMASSFYDGARAYDVALDAKDVDAMARLVGKNVLGEGREDGARRLAAYALGAEAALAAQPLDGLRRDGPDFPPLEEARS